ncbi:hypothetical protein [Luteibacter yeojuensis]|uniref:Uncharacterized protein n=1 Tax=Luteibacter yeojuensis TaxID=345309 RepID=A0A7X5QUK9_9GAMM|nr:hypothetical protein [Luteibacter yeojuensis]NID15614.1 hypothetical protein [Luteibacter yeojuensis]
MNTRLLLIAAVLASGLPATAGAADFPVNRAVSDARLDSIRGGFDFGDDLRASFALQRTVLVNGMEAIRTSISVPDIAKITNEQATALQEALRTTVVTNGMGSVADAVPTMPVVVSQAPSVGVPPVTVSAATPGAASVQIPQTAVTASLPSSGLPGLIVQNSLDNQAISATTTIDASVNTANMLQNMRVAESIQNAVIQYRGN